MALAAAALYFAVVRPFVAAFVHDAKPDYLPAALPAAILYLALVALFVFAFIASLDAWSGSLGIARKRARIFAFAFGFRDACWGLVYGVMVWCLATGKYAEVFEQVSGVVLRLCVRHVRRRAAGCIRHPARATVRH